MQLLTDLMEDSLDLGYAEAAARRSAAGEEQPQAPWRRHVLVGLGLLVVGALLATAAAATRARSGSVERAREALEQQILDRQDANERREARLTEQRLEVTRRRERALRLTDQGKALSDTLRQLEAAAGVAAVVGPGVTITLDDAPAVATDADGDPRETEQGSNRVLDADLQLVANQLWAAGAEAIAVNGQRLTVLSAIRSAGEAILVDFRPLVPPYEIAAVGPPDMASRFLDGFGGTYLDVLQGAGIKQDIKDKDDLQLPAAAGVTLRYAQVPGERLGSAPATESSTEMRSP
jgi:uncharacterized protein YlxW (UPF0749 family)